MIYKNISIFCLTTIALLSLAGCWQDKKQTPQQAINNPATTTTQTEHTFAMIKPDAVRAKNSGKIIDMIERNGFTIIRLEKTQLTKDKAEKFYGVHKDRPFFNDLITFVTSGPVVIMELEKENAIKAWRDLMGATDSTQAAPGTIRKLFGTDKSHNAVHGSDSPESAKQEIALMFPTQNK